MAHRKYGWRIAGFVFKGICTLAIIAVIGLLGWRIIDRKITPKQVTTILPNDKVCEAYLDDGKLDAFYQEQNEYTQGTNNYGYFANGGTLFISDAEQLQFVLRYNNSTLKYTSEDYTSYSVTDKSGNVQSFTSHDDAYQAAYKIDPANPQSLIKEVIPSLSRDDNVYDVTLTVMYDLTPENDTDNDGKTEDAVKYVRIQPSSEPLSHKKTLYNYRKYTFDGVVVDETVLAIYVDIYYVDDVNYEEKAYGTLMIYSYLDENIDYKLTSSDKKALEGKN